MTATKAPTTMQAIVVREFGPPSVMRLEDVPTPTPQPGEVLFQVHAVSINRTLDCVARAGRYGRPIPLPFTPGVDPSGCVVAVGDGVTSRKVGDRVIVKLIVGADAESGQPETLGGGYAQYVCASAVATTVIPDALDFATATVIFRHAPLALTLLRDRGVVQRGEWVVVMGAAGGLGSAGVQVAKHLGARVIAAAGTEERVQIGIDLGADIGVNYRKVDLTQELLRITDGVGVNVVFENIGEAGLFDAALAALARDGRLVTVGAHGGGAVPLDLTRMYQRGLTITGTTKVHAGDVERCLGLAAQGKLRALIDHVLPLSQAALGHRLVEERLTAGKIILDPTQV